MQKRIVITVGAVIALTLTTGFAQHATAPEYSSNSKLVLVPVTVTNRQGAFVAGLSKSAFTISEDGVGQPIRSFSVDEAPASVGIVLDTSGSMKGILPVARESLRRFAALANPGDQAFLATVSSHPRVWSGFTEDFDGLVNDVAFEPGKGSTALIDTIWVSLDQLRSAKNPRKALLVLSDGIDNHSRHTRSELLQRAVESDVQIYTIQMYDPPRYARGSADVVEQQHGMQLMEDLASRTGGLRFWVRSRGDIGEATAGIGQALRNQYNIGFIPNKNDQTGKFRRIHVKLTQAGLKAHSRTGYRPD